jgi:L,D-transpeptidase YcbB
MNLHTTKTFFTATALLLIAGSVFISSCKNADSSKPEIVITPEQMDKKVAELISASVNNISDYQFILADSAALNQARFVQTIYGQKNNEPIWSSNENWLPRGDSLFNFIKNAKQWGLFPEDFHFKNLDTLRTIFLNDSLAKGEKRDARFWANADILLTDALVQIVTNIKLGRLQNDSVMKRSDSVLSKEFVLEKLNAIVASQSVNSVFSSLEPAHRKYHELKAGIKNFLDSASFKTYTRVPAPGKNVSDFKKLLQQRLYEDGLISFDSTAADSVQLAAAIKKFQQNQKITADGKAGAETIRRLNITDEEKFYRIAITLDRYKMLPDTMPEKYVWVNIPAYQLQLWYKDTLKIVSRIVVGKPHTRTPVLTSAVYEMITYPKWTIPNSIIVKEILPALKRNTDYLAKKGFSLFDKQGEEVDPASVDWGKYNKGIPYNVVQGSGDANALGILKFNFINKYQVYLHDTNERYLFSRDTRALSHGCVRVQEWSKLAYFFIANDSLSYKNNQKRIGSDSLAHWLKVKEKHTIPLKNKIPVFIRYFSCEGKNGTVIFYDDIYGEDAMLREKYYSRK